MVRSILNTFRRSLRICGGDSRRVKSHTSRVESTESVRNGHITMRCFMVLTFWIVIGTLTLGVMVYGGPQLWRLFGAVVGRS